jgi:Rieske Fe-S protein
MKRREFLKSGCGACAAFAGSSFMISLLQSCAPMPAYRVAAVNKKISVPLDKFTLSDFLIVSPDRYNYDIALTKTGNEYHAYVMKCTHADNPIQFDGKTFRCDLHGSVFDHDGNVEKGPAEKPLYKLMTIVGEKDVIISLI